MADNLKLQVNLTALDKASGPLKRISGGSIGAAKALKEARDNLKQLNDQQRNISAYRKQQGAITATSEKLNQAQDRLRQLQTALRTSGEAASGKFKTDFRKAHEAVRDLTSKLQEQRRGLSPHVTKLREAGISTGKLGEHEARLATEVQAANRALETQKDRLSAINRQQGRMRNARAQYDKTQALAGSMAGAGAGAAAAGAATGMPMLAAVKSYMSFEDAMSGVAKQVAGARDDNGKLTSTYFEMADAIKAMGERIPMATTDIAALVEGAARMGVQGKENLLAFAEVAANAATAFELPADEIGENLARIADLYKIPISDVSKLGDAINYLDDNAKSKGADIIEVLQRTAGVAASVGMSYKEAAALGSTFLTLGASAEVASTATNAMVRELAIASQQPKRFQKGIKALGLETSAVQKGMATNATATLQRVLEAVNAVPKDQQLTVTTQLFGKEFGDDASKLAQNMGEYRRQLELANATAGEGSMQREAEIRAELLSARMQMAQNRAFNLAATLGETLRPTLLELFESFNSIVSSVNEWVKANPELAGQILKTVAGVAALAVGFGTVALAIASFLGPFAMVRHAMTVFGIAATTSLWPVLLVIAAVAALAAAAFLIYANWDSVVAYFGSLWDEIKAGFGGGIGGILTVLANFSPIGLFYRAFAAVMNYFGFEMPVRFTEFGSQVINSLINSMKGTLDGGFAGIAATIVNWSPLGLFYRAFAGVMSYFGVEMPGKFSEFGAQLMQGLVNGITNGLAAAKEAITGAGGAVIGWFKEKLGIHSPSRVFAQLGGFTMAGLAQGLMGGEGDVLRQIGTTAQRVVGAGAGMLGGVSIDRRAPLAARGAAGGGGGGNTYNFVINAAPGMDPAAIGREVQRQLAAAQHQQQARGRSRLADQE